MLGQTLKFAAIAVFCAMILAQVALKPSNGTNDAKDAAPTKVEATAPPRVEALAATSAPVYAPVSALDEYRIPANAQGHYVTDVFVNGQALKMVVDTGATMVALRNEDAAALGVFPLPSDFTIPINTAKLIANDLMAEGRVRRAYLGVTTLAVGGWLAEALDLPVQDGLLVEQTAKGGPAAAAGIRGGDRVAEAGMRRIIIGGDVIVALDGQKVTNQYDVDVLLNRKRPGDTVTLTVYRGAKKVDVPVKLGERDGN